jgi:hypothetical protein
MALSETDNPDEIDYYALNKEQPLHLDIDTNLKQIKLDREEFLNEVKDEMTSEENVTLEKEEKLKAIKTSLLKAYITAVKFSYFDILILMLAMLYHK